MNETVTAFLKVSHNLVRTGMYSFLFVTLGIMSRGPDRTFQGAVSGPRAVVCPSLTYPEYGKNNLPRVPTLKRKL